MVAALALAALAVVAGTPKADRLATDDGRAQRVSCGRGVDLVTADARDRVAGDCETVTRRIFVDPTTAPFAQHRTAAEPDSFAAGATVVAVFQAGRRAGAGGAAAIGWATSRDAGRTWRAGLLPGVRGSATSFVSDPTIAYDAVHTTWLAATLFGALSGSGLSVSRSPDGVAWTPPVTAASSPAAALAFDKQWIVCDNSLASPRRGRCYLAYTDVLTRTLSAIWSDDGGVTWSTASVLAAPVSDDGLTGSQPAVLPDGTLVVVFWEGDRIRAAVSRDGGATATAVVDVAPTATLRTWLRPGALSLPSVEVGGDGRVRAVWAGAAFRDVNDVALVSSADGMVWTAPARVPAIPGGGAFLPSVAAHPSGDDLAVTAYRVTDAGVDSYVVASADAGATWTPPRRLSARTVRASWTARAPAPFLGDYFSTSFSSGRIVSVLILAAPPSDGALNQGVYATSISMPS